MKNKNLLVLFILLLIFIIPIILAWYFYEKGETVGEGTINYGQLIQPPRDFNKIDRTQQFRGKWTMLLVCPRVGEKSCEKMLYNMRQIRLATGKNMERIQRVMVTFPTEHFSSKFTGLLQSEYIGTVHLVISHKQFQSVMAGLPSTKLASGRGYLYLVDPLGNIMMGYPLDANPSGIFKDLQRLLRVSQIG